MSSRSRQPWDERALLLLGALMVQSQHGYQLNDFIEQCRVAEMNKSTAYAILGRLADGGYVSVHVEQVGRRPQRSVYTITDPGKELFHQLLSDNLESVQSITFPGDIGLMLLDYLPRPEAIGYLKRQLAERDAELASFPQQLPPDHAGHLSLELALDHLLTMRRANRDWLARAIERLEQEPAIDPAMHRMPERSLP